MHVFKAVLVTFATVVWSTSGVKERCDSGTRVFSLGAWHGDWLDGFDVRCTGGGELLIPPEYDEDGGGSLTPNICSGTAGVRSIDWFETTALSFLDYNSAVVNVTVTCMDGQVSELLASSADWDDLDPVYGTICEEGEYVSGIEYELGTVDRRRLAEGSGGVESSSDSSLGDDAQGHASPLRAVGGSAKSVSSYSSSTTSGGGDDSGGQFSYVITSIDVVCSSEVLDDLCSADICSGGLSLKAEQPEYCEGAVCNEAECCEEGDDSPAISTVAGILIGVAGLALCGIAVCVYMIYSKKKSGGTNGAVNRASAPVQATPAQLPMKATWSVKG